MLLVSKCSWTLELDPQLFKRQTEFFDKEIENLTVTQIRAKLVELALPIVGADKKQQLIDLLTFNTTPNGGIAVTDDLKYTSEWWRYALDVALTEAFSQVCETEFHSRVTDRAMGWPGCQRGFELMGRARMVKILRRESNCMKVDENLSSNRL